MERAPAATIAETPAHQRWLLPVHAGWCAAVLVDVIVCLFGISAFWKVVHQPCSGAGTACIPVQLQLADFRALGGPGSAIDAYAVYALVMVLIATLAEAGVGGLIAWRKWNDPMGLFVSLVFITGASGMSTFGATATLSVATDSIHVPDVLALSGPVMSVVGIVVEELSSPLLAIFLLTFPTGRFAPRWSILLMLLWIVQAVLFFVNVPFAIIELSLVTTVGGTAIVQVYRYMRVYTPVQRQQTKWVVFIFACATVPVLFGYVVAPMFWPSLNTPGSAYRMGQIGDLMLTNTLFPLSIGVAILRNRLYGIDVIIRRTLIYGSLTAILVAVYFGVVVGLQSLVTALTHQTNPQPIIIAATTLLIAALFNPLRHRIQAIIDRRFYRAKYDAARALQAFAASLRTETDLRELSERLIAAVRETMQPAHVSLWLRAPEKPPVGERP